MRPINHLRELKRIIGIFTFKIHNWRKERFTCPICDYNGPFKDIHKLTELRKHAKCPKCNSLERHRLQYLVIQSIFEKRNTGKMRMLHVAPEPFFRDLFSMQFGRYETADLNMEGVDYKVDIQNLPFAGATYDFVFASHVLEHIPHDIKAIAEIRRILKPNGIAILPVPVIVEKTVEYPEPNSYDNYHVRAPGPDYFDRFTQYFSRIEKFASDSFPEKYQLFVYEDRSNWPTDKCPLQTPMKGEKHIDIVPVCYV